MTTDKEQQAFGLVVERQRRGASENDIRAAFQRFMETASIAALAESTTEAPPGVGNPGRMDLYVHNTCEEEGTGFPCQSARTSERAGSGRTGRKARPRQRTTWKAAGSVMLGCLLHSKTRSPLRPTKGYLACSRWE